MHNVVREPKFKLGDLVCVDLHVDKFFGFVESFNYDNTKNKYYYDVYVFMDKQLYKIIDEDWINYLEDYKFYLEK
jgi:hypothetical protein